MNDTLQLEITNDVIDNLVVKSRKLDQETDIAEKIKLHKDLTNTIDKLKTEISGLIDIIDKVECNVNSPPSTDTDSTDSSASELDNEIDNENDTDDEDSIVNLNNISEECDKINDEMDYRKRVDMCAQICKKLEKSKQKIRSTMNVEHLT